MSAIDIAQAPEGVLPKCPHCKSELREVWVRKEGWCVVEQEQILMCPYCHCLLRYGAIGR